MNRHVCITLTLAYLSYLDAVAFTVKGHNYTKYTATSTSLLR